LRAGVARGAHFDNGGSSRRIEVAIGSDLHRPDSATRGGAERAGDELPVLQVREGRRQMHHDAPRRGLHPGAELQELFAQGAYLSPTEGGAYRFEAQFLIEDVRSGGEQRSKLIGEEAGAAGAVDLEPVVQLFDPIFYVAASALDRFVQVLGRSFEVRDHEGRIVFGVATGMATTSALMIARRRWGQVRAP
jgi:hypothetical protein